MSFLRIEDKKKWLNAFVALFSFIIGFISYRFLLQLSAWFELEAKIKNFIIVAQVSSLVISLIILFVIFKHKKAMEYLSEVYSELVKVVWPGKDETIKLTIGIVIGTAILSVVFVLIDLLFQKLLTLVY